MVLKKFIKWCGERDFGIVVLTLLLSSSVSLLASQANERIISPLITGNLEKLNIAQRPDERQHKKVEPVLFLGNLLEFFLTVFMIYCVSNFVFKNENFKPALI